MLRAACDLAATRGSAAAEAAGCVVDTAVALHDPSAAAAESGARSAARARTIAAAALAGARVGGESARRALHWAAVALVNHAEVRRSYSSTAATVRVSQRMWRCVHCTHVELSSCRLPVDP
jgi:hypothetical protein